eukprot:1175728-Prorocentrum_minimum.AAC.1
MLTVMLNSQGNVDSHAGVTTPQESEYDLESKQLNLLGEQVRRHWHHLRASARQPRALPGSAVGRRCRRRPGPPRPLLPRPLQRRLLRCSPHHGTDIRVILPTWSFILMVVLRFTGPPVPITARMPSTPQMWVELGKLRVVAEGNVPPVSVVAGWTNRIQEARVYSHDGPITFREAAPASQTPGGGQFGCVTRWQFGC